jgi:8-oxo-dGTP diphosphatase
MPEKNYVIHPKYYVAVDCVIFGYELGELKLLLHPRRFEPLKGSLSLMGGFVQEQESVEEAARRVLMQTTGLQDIFLKQVKAFSEPTRDLGARVISVAFVALIPLHKHNKDLVHENGAHWCSVTRLPDLVFDHGTMVQKALECLQRQASTHLAGKELLPSQFTLMQLRQLYEAIFQKTFDPGNFRKKTLSMNVLERLNEKNTTESKKGAFYYAFKASENTSENFI